MNKVFLLVQIYVSSLEDKLTPNAVKTALQFFENQRGFRNTSEAAGQQVHSQAYDQAMDRIHNHKSGYSELAEKALA